MIDLIPVSVLSGFLGSGKTTFLNRILQGDHGRKIAVLVNELGDIGVDAQLLNTDDSFVQLDNGCICCSLNEDLPITLAEMAKLQDLDHVVIETTGIADPMPVGFAVSMPETKDLFQLDALISMADCCQFLTTVDDYEEVRAQIKHADLVILTKTDLSDEETTKEVAARVEELNPKVRILNGADDSCLALALDLKVERQKTERILTVSPKHTQNFDSMSYAIGQRATIRYAFEEFLDYLPKNVIRAKGIVPLDGERGRLVFHRVGERLDMTFETDRSDDGMLVLIGQSLDKARLKDELDCLFEAV